VSKTTKSIFVGVIFAGLGIAALGAGPLLERLDSDVFKDTRLVILPVTAKAAIEHLPFGSGVGTFVPVYAAREPIETMVDAFVNHAHNDFLELWLETGVAGALVIIAFIVWWTSRVWISLRAPSSGRNNLILGAAVTTGLLLAHSAIEYPMRTQALACLFAMLCGFLCHAGASPAADPIRSRLSRTRTRSGERSLG